MLLRNRKKYYSKATFDSQAQTAGWKNSISAVHMIGLYVYVSPLNPASTQLLASIVEIIKIKLSITVIRA